MYEQSLFHRLGTLLEIQGEIALKYNSKERKGEEDFRTQRAYFQAENHTDKDSDVWKQVLYRFFYQAYHKNKILIMKHCLCKKQTKD